MKKLFGSLKPKPNKTSKHKRKKQEYDPIFDNITKEKDTISPTVMREIDKSDNTISGKPNDYYVEVGTTMGLTRYFRSFFARLMGENTYFGMFNDIFLGNFGDADSDIAIHVSPTDDTKTRFFLGRKIAGLEADLSNETNTLKAKAIRDNLIELHAQEERLRKNIEQLYSVSIQAMVSGDSLDKVKKFSNSMIKRAANQSIFFRGADTKQLSALLSMTPCDNTKRDFKHTFKNMETSNVADLFPFGFGTISHTRGVLIGEDMYGKPVFYDDRHPGLLNYNSLTLGESGSGKSMKTKLLQARKSLSQTMSCIIDFEHENRDWIQELGFPYLELSSTNTKDTMNIFPIPRIILDKQGKPYADIDDAVNTVSAIVFKMLKITTERPLMGTKKILIKDAIQRCYEIHGITYDSESIYDDEAQSKSDVFTLERQIKKMPQLVELYELMNQVPELNDEAIIIKSFTHAGNIKSQAVFDCQTTVDIKNSLILGISVEGLDEIMRPLGLYTAFTNTWSIYERLPMNIKKDILIDEAQNAMQEDEEATLLENRIRIARRRNIGIHPITQGFEVFLRKPQGMGILKNTATKFLFRQSGMDIDSIQGKFNLPEGVKERLLSFEAGECIFIVGNEMTQLKTKPMKHEYRLFSTNPNEAEVMV